jgi:TetR/AcrR family tetracycline transcriptional repressor
MKSTRRKRRASAPLDRDRIARAAVARIESDGLLALSMRALASDLGCEAMSLYHHVDGIEGVLDAVVEDLFDRLLRVPLPLPDARKSLAAFADAYLALADSFPHAFPLLATRLLHTPRALAAVGQLLGLLRELGLTQRAALRQARVIAAYLNGAGLALAAWRLAPGGGRRTAQAAEGDPVLGPLVPEVQAQAVHADLKAGLKSLLDDL